ncbi:hypothetical protein [Methylocystis sp. B8]|uniref:hypothetical protein n=1 Tax=Methylocystis sp. B8 TaxID=544938 RepID=UPI0010FDDC99|nr:hypothetical protein [Methylocystis sp. B8]TLG77724.1 hypothetical protein FEV16_07810 [Methylocystis sp. B8]
MRTAAREVIAIALIAKVSLAYCLIFGTAGAFGEEQQRAPTPRIDTTINTILVGPSKKSYNGPLTLHFLNPLGAPEPVRGEYKFPDPAGPGEVVGTVGMDPMGHYNPLILTGTWFEARANLKCEHSYKDEVGPETPAKEYWY